MNEFFVTYKSQIINAAIVIGAVVFLYLFTGMLYRWLLSKEKGVLPETPLRPINIIKRILNVLWLVLGIISLGFVFKDSESETLIQSFKLASYLGIVSIITIVAASVSNLWFKYKIQDKIELHFDPTSFKFLRYVVVFTICFVGVFFGLLAFPSLKGVAQTA